MNEENARIYKILITEFIAKRYSNKMFIVF